MSILCQSYIKYIKICHFRFWIESSLLCVEQANYYGGKFVKLRIYKQGKNKQPLLVAACKCDAMTNPQYPLEGAARVGPSRG